MFEPDVRRARTRTAFRGVPPRNVFENVVREPRSSDSFLFFEERKSLPETRLLHRGAERKRIVVLET